VEETFGAYMQTLTIIARLHGVKPVDMPRVQLAEDRSGLVLAAIPVIAGVTPRPLHSDAGGKRG
jgi:hypothetical protein